MLKSIDAQSVTSYKAFAETDRKGTSVRALAGGTAKSGAIIAHDVRSATAGAAAAASPTTTSLQFFSYALRLLTAGHGFLCVSEAANARIAASGQDAQLHDRAEAQKQNVNMRALKDLLDRDSFLAENIGAMLLCCMRAVDRPTRCQASPAAATVMIPQPIRAHKQAQIAPKVFRIKSKRSDQQSPPVLLSRSNPGPT
jgi:hypothetical protein